MKSIFSFFMFVIYGKYDNWKRFPFPFRNMEKSYRFEIVLYSSKPVCDCWPGEGSNYTKTSPGF